MIQPTIGRRVWYWPGDIDSNLLGVLDRSQPLDAGIAYVWNDRLVNLTVACQGGNMATSGRTNVKLLQPGDERPPASQSFAEWMPYQKARASSPS